MRPALSSLLLILGLVLATAAATTAKAHHPGDELDEAMGSRERFFQVIDRPAPPFTLAKADGDPVRLADFADKVVVLNFVFASCTDVCPLHSAMIADVQAKVNATPMKERVQFLTVTTDPERDTEEVLRSYGEAHGLDPDNWLFLTRRPEDPEDATRELAETYGLAFEPLEDGQQLHGVVTHVIDRDGRYAARFHGLRFDPLNLVTYINGLTNAPARDNALEGDGWWAQLKGLFR